MSGYPETSAYVERLQKWVKEILPSSGKQKRPEKALTLTLLHVSPEAFAEKGVWETGSRRERALEILHEWCEEMVTALSDEFPLFTVRKKEVVSLPDPHDWLIRTDPEYALIETQATKIGEHLFATYVAEFRGEL